MEEQFEYGEWVGVRDDESHVWVLRQYIDTVEFGDTGIKAYCIFLDDENPDNHSGHGRCYRQIRKHVPEPEPALIDIEQPETKPLFISTQGVFTAEEAVMQLQERIEKILEELKELKTQIK